MKHSNLTGLVFGAFISAAFGQATELPGKWTSPMVGQSGNEVAVELVLSESGGIWRMTPQPGRRGKSNPCFGKEFPVIIVSKSPDVVLEINGSKVIPGCIDQTASLKVIDGKTLEGSLKDGRALKFVRQ